MEYGFRGQDQFATNNQDLAALWEEYRQRMVSLAGVAIFLFGNKTDGTGGIVIANGVKREFEISVEQGLVPIPIGITGFAAKEIFTEISLNPEKYFPNRDWIHPLISQLNEPGHNANELVAKIVLILKRLNR